MRFPLRSRQSECRVSSSPNRPSPPFGKTPLSHKAEKTDLEAYFFEVLPDYDEDRVYASDIRKVIQWYNLLHDNGITDFSEPEAEAQAEGDSAEGAE